MVNRCCVLGCRSSTHDSKKRKVATGIIFHRFPAWRQVHGSQISEITKARRIAWIAAVRRKDISFNSIPSSFRVCSRHFHSGEFNRVCNICHHFTYTLFFAFNVTPQKNKQKCSLKLYRCTWMVKVYFVYYFKFFFML